MLPEQQPAGAVFGVLQTCVVIASVKPKKQNQLRMENSKNGKNGTEFLISCELAEDKKMVLPPKYHEYAKSIEDFQVYDDDVWVITSPKSGTYWMQETLCCLLHGMDFEKLHSMNYRRAYNIELQGFSSFDVDDVFQASNMSKFCETLERPRVMRTHLFWDKLPKALRDENCKAKIIYVARNPKDVCISRYYYTQMFPGNDFEKILKSPDIFANEFLNGRLVYTPYWKHLMDFWNKRKSSRVLFVKYEDMKADLPKVLDRLQVFLGLHPLTNQQKVKVADYLSFAKMKENQSLQNFMHCDYKIFRQTYKNSTEEASFMRKGKAGGWKEEMSPEIIQRFDDWILENTTGTGYSVDAE